MRLAIPSALAALLRIEFRANGVRYPAPVEAAVSAYASVLAVLRMEIGVVQGKIGEARQKIARGELG